MHIKTRALIKGVSNKEWNGKSYHSIEIFGVEGTAADMSVGVDLATQKSMFEQADKIKPAVADMVIDMTFYDRRAQFKLVSLQAGPAK